MKVRAISFRSTRTWASGRVFSSIGACIWLKAPRLAAIPAYTRVDATMMWQTAERLRLQVGVQNAFDSEHTEFLRRSGPQAEIGRAVYAQATFR